jgi:hypothetical protein
MNFCIIYIVNVDILKLSLLAVLIIRVLTMGCKQQGLQGRLECVIF